MKHNGWTYTVEVSFLEIYNEQIRDLLNPNSQQTYEIRFNEGKGTTVTNLKIKSVGSAEELESLMALANKNRAVAATDFNLHSSRSHAVTKIILKGYNFENKVWYESFLIYAIKVLAKNPLLNSLSLNAFMKLIWETKNMFLLFVYQVVTFNTFTII